MARAETRHIMSDRLVGDTGDTVTKMMRNTGGESTSGRHGMTEWIYGRDYDDLRARGAGRPNEFNMYVLESKFEYSILEITSLYVEISSGSTVCGV